jgi:zinc transport system ATP-binding protein
MTTSASASQAAPVLDVRHLTVRFSDTAVLQDLSFSVPAGSSMAVIGPNGSGKTVLFKALIGAIPFEGDVRWAPGVRLGYVPQKLDLQRDVPITGLDFLKARRAITGPKALDVATVLSLVGLSIENCRRPIGALSGGQFQRLLVAFALVGDPTVLLLDEPTAGVDEPGQERLNELVHRLEVERGLTVLLISHELSIVYKYATSVICLGGTQVKVGPPAQVLSDQSLHAIYGSAVGLHAHDH